MKTYKKSIRDGQDNYTRYEGLDESTIQILMAELNHTMIEDITEEQYIAAASGII